MVSASGNHNVQHAEVRACVSSRAGQVSAARAARACVTVIHDTPAEEGIDQDEVDEEVRPEGYLSGSPEGDTRGFRDSLRAEDPILCLTSSSPSLALPAPPRQAPLLLPPPPPPEPTSAMETSAEGSLKRKAEEQGARPPKRQRVLDQNWEDEVDESQPDKVSALSAPPMHPGDVAEPSHPPSPEPSPSFQLGISRSQRPTPQYRPGKSVRKADWEPRFLREFEEYQRVDRIFRWQIWEEWTSGERLRAYMYTTNMRLKEEMRVWKRRVEARSRVSQGSAVRADTQI